MSRPPPLKLHLTIEYTRVELTVSLRHLRAVRAAYAGDLISLHERTLQRGTDIVAQSAILALATELDLLDKLIAKHWVALGIVQSDDHLEDHLQRRHPPVPPDSEGGGGEGGEGK